MLKRYAPYVVFFLLHVFASVAAFLWNYQISSNRFDGRSVSPQILRLSSAALEVLWFPLAKPLFAIGHMPGLLGWFPVLLNSALWGIALALLIHWQRRRRT